MKILIISPFFAPYSLVGAKRMGSLANFLAEKGHNVTVMAYDEETLKLFTDKNNLKSRVSENIDIIRVKLPFRIKNKLGLFLNHIIQTKVWYRVLKNIDVQKYDVMIVSCGPTVTEGPVLQIAKKNHIPLIIDLRDLDILDACQKKNKTIKQILKSVWNKLQYKVELHCINISSKVVVVTPGMVDRIEKEYKLRKEKIEIIYNGFDSSELYKLDKEINDISVKKDRKFKIGYFGKLMYYSPERGKMILQSLDILKKMGKNIELVHVGPDSSYISDVISNIGLDDSIYHSMGTKDYLSGMKIMKTMDAFFIEYKDMIGLGTKVFDYIFCNKPIICVAPLNCVLSNFVNEFKNGYSVDTVDDIVFALQDIIYENRLVLDDDFDIYKYSRNRQNSNYENLIIKIVEQDVSY